MKKLAFLFLLILGLTSFQTNSITKFNTNKAFIIGVAHYPKMESWKYTDDDAYRFFAFHKSQLIPDENITILIDEDATNKVIIDELTKVAASCKEQENLFLYFSGVSDSTGIFGIDKAVKYEQLGNILKKSNAKHKLLIINSAYSEIAQKSFDKNTTVFFAGSEGEETPEDNALRQTIFAHFIIRGLKGTADINENKTVTLAELEEYTATNVRAYTKGKQNPKMINFKSFEWDISER
jgi:hypothetical protein